MSWQKMRYVFLFLWHSSAELDCNDFLGQEFKRPDLDDWVWSSGRAALLGCTHFLGGLVTLVITCFSHLVMFSDS